MQKRPHIVSTIVDSCLVYI